MFLTLQQMGALVLFGLWACLMLAIVFLFLWLLKWAVWQARDIPQAPKATPMQQPPLYQSNGYQQQQYQPQHYSSE